MSKRILKCASRQSLEPWKVIVGLLKLIKLRKPFIGNELQSLNGRVLIPTDTWKAVYIPEEGKMGVYWVPNKNTVTANDIERISVNELQRRIGIDVFPSVKDPALRNRAGSAAGSRAQCERGTI